MLLHKKCPSLVNHKGVLLLHNNTRPQIAQVVVEMIMTLNMKVLPHLPYSPDLILSIIFSGGCTIFKGKTLYSIVKRLKLIFNISLHRNSNEKKY